MKAKQIFSWSLRIIAALILLQTLYFKFTGQPESVALFSELGVEPWGRIGTGIVELIASILLLVPATAFIGAIMGIGLMLGAIFSHITVLGISSDGDGGQLFIMATIVLVCCIIILFIHRQQAITMIRKILNK